MTKENKSPSAATEGEYMACASQRAENEISENTTRIELMFHGICWKQKAADGVSFVFSKKPTIEQLEEMRGVLRELIENPDLIKHSGQTLNSCS